MHQSVTIGTKSPLHMSVFIKRHAWPSKYTGAGVINLFYLLSIIDHNMFLMETALLAALTKCIRIHTMQIE